MGEKLFYFSLFYWQKPPRYKLKLTNTMHQLMWPPSPRGLQEFMSDQNYQKKLVKKQTEETKVRKETLIC